VVIFGVRLTTNQSFRFLRSNHDKVSAAKLGPLSALLPFSDTLSVIPFSKKNYFDLILLNYWISTIKLVFRQD